MFLVHVLRNGENLDICRASQRLVQERYSILCHPVQIDIHFEINKVGTARGFFEKSHGKTILNFTSLDYGSV